LASERCSFAYGAYIKDPTKECKNDQHFKLSVSRNNLRSSKRYEDSTHIDMIQEEIVQEETSKKRVCIKEELTYLEDTEDACNPWIIVKPRRNSKTRIQAA
jgi:hypothetical protein